MPTVSVVSPEQVPSTWPVAVPDGERIAGRCRIRLDQTFHNDDTVSSAVTGRRTTLPVPQPPPTELWLHPHRRIGCLGLDGTTPLGVVGGGALLSEILARCTARGYTGGCWWRRH